MHELTKSRRKEKMIGNFIVEENLFWTQHGQTTALMKKMLTEADKE